APLWYGALWPIAAFALDSRGLARAVVRLESAGRKAAKRLLSRMPPGLSLWIQTNPWMRNRHLAEPARVVGLVGAALWLLRGFMKGTQNGTADAYWYGLNLADTVAQVRAGV